ncbi:hypothetical protein DMN91_009761 [Ooceraea biroi]|uniref:Mos1 transposase HTH domain-containing protein n=1 Tax=Ooceraea biroi TaxID=2015173 RepID=A0A3L8DB13_OOCBI|nr:hypothetical protein DMN91_009761 [Ooceraea biroi]
MENKEIRIISLYEFKLGHSAALATRNINTAFGEGSANERRTRRWFEKFRSGDTNLDNLPRGHAPFVIDDTILKDMIEVDPTLTVREVAERLNVHHSTVVRHLRRLGKVKKLDKWVPHELMERDKIRRLETCISLLSRHNNDGILHRIVTCDEKWILYDNRRRSAQWLNVNEPPKRMPKPNLHPKKIMVSVWWSSKGIVHYSFNKQGEAINADKYCQEIDIMYANLCAQQPALVNRHGVLLLHDNAKPHVAKKTIKKLSELNIEVLPHPPYSPDISPTDYHLFKHLDGFLTGKVFQEEKRVKDAFHEFIGSCSSDFFKHGIDTLVSRWNKCIEIDGDYFD